MDRIYDLEQLLPLMPAELLRDDLSSLVTSVLEYVGKTRHVENLRRVLLARSGPEVDALRASAELIEKLNLKGPRTLIAERSVDALAILNDFRSGIEKLEAEADTLDSGRLQASDGQLADLLLCAAAAKADLTALVDLTKQKIQLLNDSQVLELWSRIQGEFSPDRADCIKVNAKILPKNWLTTATIPEMRDKIADYLVTIKPRLRLAMVKSGRQAIAQDAPGLASVLTVSHAPVAPSLSRIELDLVAALKRLRGYWESVFVRPANEFDRALGLDARASCCVKKEDLAALSELAAAANYSERLIIYELKKIIRSLHAPAQDAPALEKALIQYKLGIEIMAPENLKDLVRKDELRLQKELCKFLLERGILAVGTKFGRAETDLLAGLADEGTTIEAKIYKDAGRLSEKTVKGNFVELQNAMRQDPARRRGVLVVYNFTSMCISAPREWINGRFWFLAINLQRQPPNSRNRALVIERTDDDDGIRVVSRQSGAFILSRA
jgi:hypothetical protein